MQYRERANGSRNETEEWGEGDGRRTRSSRSLIPSQTDVWVNAPPRFSSRKSSKTKVKAIHYRKYGSMATKDSDSIKK